MLKIIQRAFSPTNVKKSIETSGDEVDDADEFDRREMEENLSKINPFRVRFLIPEPRIAFTRLRKAFIKAPIFYYFDLECYMRIETDAFSFVMSRIFSQLTLGHMTYTNLDFSIFEIGQWYLVALFSRKTIPAETWYETHDGELLVIIEIFKTWRHCPKGYKHTVFVFINHNNLCLFMNTKNLRAKQIRSA